MKLDLDQLERLVKAGPDGYPPILLDFISEHRRLRALSEWALGAKEAFEIMKAHDFIMCGYGSTNGESKSWKEYGKLGRIAIECLSKFPEEGE